MRRVVAYQLLWSVAMSFQCPVAGARQPRLNRWPPHFFVVIGYRIGPEVPIDRATGPLTSPDRPALGAPEALASDLQDVAQRSPRRSLGMRLAFGLDSHPDQDLR